MSVDYVVAIECMDKQASAPRHYIAFCTTERVCWTKRVRCGEWEVTDLPTMAFLFTSMKGAKGAARSAIVRHVCTNVADGQADMKWRAAVYAVFGERGIRWTGKTLGPEMWPNQTDPIGTIATL